MSEQGDPPGQSSFRLAAAPAPGKQLIQGYRAGGFTIAGVRHQGSVIVTVDATFGWPAAALGDVTIGSLEPALRATPAIEILVLGIGERFAPVPHDLHRALRERGIGLEPMDTRAACRTFNVLLAEDRRVAAALIAL